MGFSRLILASASPRRRDLLAQLGVEFEIHASNVCEDQRDDEDSHEYVLRMAGEKAEAVYGRVIADSKICKDNDSNLDCVVIGGDTSILLDGDILGKPEDRFHALEMLMRLSGREHKVLSAVCVVNKRGKKLLLSETLVHFRNLSFAELEIYWNTGEPAGKAGAYAIQGLAAAFVSSIEGSYSGIVGLPLAETYQLLQGVNVITGLSSQKIAYKSNDDTGI